jgi:uncharacterized protein (TIGR02001 family)
MRLARTALLILAAIYSAPAAATDISAEAGLVSDYRYRGYSLSEGKPAVQASVSLEHDSGLYGSVWSSTIRQDDFDADIEIDLVGGYALDLSDKLSLDFSATYYLYPSEPGANYAEATVVVERSIGAAALSAGISFVPPQHGTLGEDGRKKGNRYLFVGASYEVPAFPLTLNAALGHERGFFDEVDQGGKWDWSLGASLKRDHVRLGAAYTGTDAGSDALVASLFFEF